MPTLEDLKSRLADAKKRHHEGKPVEPGAIRGLATEINRQLTEGCCTCSDCGGRPLCIEQPGSIEIGCLNCRDHRVKRPNIEDARQAWNAGKFSPRG